jgi:hypothetical protein
MVMANCNVELSNLILTGGDAGKESEYIFPGTSTLIQSKRGGALHIATRTTAKLHNMRFEHNYGASDQNGDGGGVIILDWMDNNVSSTTYSVDVTFTGTTVFEGNIGGKGTIQGRDYLASTGGGLCIMTGASVKFEGEVLFKDNIAALGNIGIVGRGGGMIVDGRAKVSFAGVTSLRFIRNIASEGSIDGLGGAIWYGAFGFTIPSTANAVFSDNRASFSGNGTGGAICMFASQYETGETPYTLCNVLLENNVAVYSPNATSSGLGGAIWISGAAYIVVLKPYQYTATKLTLTQGTTIRGNVASKGRGGNVLGGGVYVDNENPYRGSLSKVVLEDASICGNIMSDNPEAPMRIYNGGGVFSTNEVGISLPSDAVPRVYDNLPCVLAESSCYGEYNIYPDLTYTVHLDNNARERYHLVGSNGKEYSCGDFIKGVQIPSFQLKALSQDVVASPDMEVYPLSQRFNNQATPTVTLTSTNPLKSGWYEYNRSLTEGLYLWPVFISTIRIEKKEAVTFTPNYPTTHPDGVHLAVGGTVEFSILVPSTYTKFGSHVGIYKGEVFKEELIAYQQTSEGGGKRYYYRYSVNRQNAEDVTLRHYFDCLAVQLPPVSSPSHGTEYVNYPSSSEYPDQPSPNQIYYLGEGESFSVLVKNTSPVAPTFFQLLLEDFHTVSEVEEVAGGLYRFTFTVPDWRNTHLFANSVLKLKFITSTEKDCLIPSLFQKKKGSALPPFFTLTLPRLPEGVTTVSETLFGDIRPPVQSADTTYYFSPYPPGSVEAEVTVCLPVHSASPDVSANLTPLAHDEFISFITPEKDGYVYKVTLGENTILLMNQANQRTVRFPELPSVHAPILYYNINSSTKEGYYTGVKGQYSRNYALSFGGLQVMGGLLPQIISGRWHEESGKVVQDTVLQSSIADCNVQVNSNVLLHFQTNAYEFTLPPLPEGVSYAENLRAGKLIYPNTGKSCVDTFGVVASGRYQYVSPTVTIPSPGSIRMIKKESSQNANTYWYEFTARDTASIRVSFNYEKLKLPLWGELPEGVQYADLGETGGEYFRSSEYPFTFQLNLSGIAAEKSVRVVFVREGSGKRDTIDAVAQGEKLSSYTLESIGSGYFDIRFSLDTVTLPSTLPEGLSYNPSSKLQAGKYAYHVGGTFRDTLVLDLAFTHVGLLPLVMVNGKEVAAYEEVVTMFRYVIEAQGSNAVVNIGLPNYKVSLVTTGKPEGVEFADAAEGKDYYCRPGSTFTFDLIVSPSVAGRPIPAVESSGNQAPRFSHEVSDRRYRYAISELSGPATITVAGLISGQIILPGAEKLPVGLTYFTGKAGDAYLTGGNYTYPVTLLAKDSFALLIGKKYRQVEPIVTSSTGTVTKISGTDSTRVYRVETTFGEGNDYRDSIFVKLPSLSTIELPAAPEGVVYADGFEAGTWYYTASAGSVFRFTVRPEERYKDMHLLLMRGETAQEGEVVEGALRFTLQGGENISNLSFKREYHRLVLQERLPVGLSYLSGEVSTGQALLGGGEYFLKQGVTKVHFAVEINRLQVAGADAPVVKANGGSPMVPDSSVNSGAYVQRYYYSYSTQGNSTTQVTISIPFYKITLSAISAELVNMVGYANGSEPEEGVLAAGEVYGFYLYLKLPYTEADLVVKVDGELLTPEAKGNHVYYFSFQVNNNVTPEIGVRYSCVSLAALPTGVVYTGTRSDKTPLYHKYANWRDSFSVTLLSGYTLIRPLVKTSDNVTLQPTLVSGSTYKYVFTGSGDMTVTVSLPYTTVNFPALPSGLSYVEPVSAGSFRYSTGTTLSFGLRTSENFLSAMPLVKHGSNTLFDEDSNGKDNVYKYSVYLTESNLSFGISLDYYEIKYKAIDPALRLHFSYDVSLRDSGSYYFSPSIATCMDTFAIVCSNTEGVPFNLQVTASNGAILQEVEGKPYTYVVITTTNTEVTVTVGKFSVMLPELPTGMVYDRPLSNSPSDYPSEAGNYLMFPFQRFTFTLRPTGNYASLVPEVHVNGSKLMPAVYTGNKYEYSFVVKTASSTPVISMSSISCTLPVLPEGFLYSTESPNKTSGVWPHNYGVPFRDTFELVVDASFANVQYTVTATTPTFTEILVARPGTNRYVVYGDGMENVTVSLVASYHTITLPSLSSTPQIHYASGSRTDGVAYRQSPGVPFTFTIERASGGYSEPTAELTGMTVSRSELSANMYQFTFTIPADADKNQTYTPTISYPILYPLTLPSTLPKGVHYAKDSISGGRHLIAANTDMVFTLETETGLGDIVPVVTRTGGTTIPPTIIADNTYRFNCGQNQEVEIESIKMNFYTVILNAPPSGVVIAPLPETYNMHTDNAFTFTVMPSSATQPTVKSNGVTLTAVKFENGGYYYSITPLLHDTFRVEVLQGTGTVEPESEGGVSSGVVYRDEYLYLRGLNGRRIGVVSLTGALLAGFTTEERVRPLLVSEADYWVYPISLPAGVYILYGEKEGERPVTVKFVVR